MGTTILSEGRSKYQCNLCGNSTYKHRYDLTSRLGCDPRRFNVVKCIRCTLHSLFPIPTTVELEEIYRNYAEQGDRINVERSRVQHVYPGKIALIAKHVSNGNEVLDIGAGLGGFASLARKNGLAVTGVEFEKQQCVLAKQLFDVDLICSSFEEFFKTSKAVLVSAQAILKGNGKLILEVPNQFFVLKNEVYARLGRLRFKKPYNPYHHLYFFSPYTLKSMVRATGFRILECNEVHEGANRSVKNRINHVVSRVFKMGVSNRIEVVASRSDSRRVV